jgi:hypothetical protein
VRGLVRTCMKSLVNLAIEGKRRRGGCGDGGRGRKKGTL